MSGSVSSPEIYMGDFIPDLYSIPLSPNYFTCELWIKTTSKLNQLPYLSTGSTVISTMRSL